MGKVEEGLGVEENEEEKVEETAKEGTQPAKKEE